MTRSAQLLLRGSGWIESALRTVAYALSWTLLLLVLTVCTDVLTRRFGFRVPGLDSTRFQEIEWHLQAVVFCVWVGYAYCRNAHIRVDVLVAGLSPRTKCKIEIAGCLVLALPYLLVALPNARDFMIMSYMQGESSSSPMGLPHRFLVKGLLYVAFWSLLLATLSVLLKNIAILLDPDAADARATS